MTDKVKNTALVVSSLAALALGGSAIAGAASNDNAASTASTRATAHTQGAPRQRADETLLTGDAASKVAPPHSPGSPAARSSASRRTRTATRSTRRT